MTLTDALILLSREDARLWAFCMEYIRRLHNPHELILEREIIKFIRDIINSEKFLISENSIAKLKENFLLDY